MVSIGGEGLGEQAITRPIRGGYPVTRSSDGAGACHSFDRDLPRRRLNMRLA